MLCCQSDVLVALTDVLKIGYKKLDPRCALQILKMIEALVQHSISPFELKQLIGLLQDKDFENQDSNNQLVGVKFPQKFPYKSHVIHVISSMARGSGFEVCRHYFDIRTQGDLTLIIRAKTRKTQSSNRQSSLILSTHGIFP